MLTCKIDYSVQNDESLRVHCTNERRVIKIDKNSVGVFFILYVL